MTPSAEIQSGTDQRLVDLIDQIAGKMRRGEVAGLETCVREHPEYADRLRELLPALELMADLSVVHGDSSVSAASGSPGAVVSSVPATGVLGDFRILREIGRGGMGVVYEVEQISLGRRMALKVLPFAGALDERQLTRFRNEARAAASLEHPNIVRVHSVGCERGVHYYAMEFIDGQTLAQVIDGLRQQGEGGEWRVAGGGTHPLAVDAPPHCSPLAPHPSPLTPSPPHPITPSLPAPDTSPKAAVSTHRSHRTPEFFRSVAQLGIQAAEALEHAHQMGVVHRDIKPSNLMVDARGHLWITDFGLAMTQKDPALTLTGDILGTLRYMSPEQAAGKSRVLDHHTDIYSLGLTLYELLTLRPAFEGDDRQRLVREILETDPPAPRQHNPSIPRDLETIVLKATAKEPNSRYATAQALADDLRRYLDDQPIRARRPSLVERVGKWARRHKPVVWSAIGTAVVFLLTLALSTFMIAGAYEREKDEREAADEQRWIAQRQEALAKEQKDLAVRQRDISERNLYVAHMRLAQRDWELGQISRLHEMLDGHVPEPGRPDLRGWEWYYHLSLCHSELLTLRGHSGSVMSVAWSPDGKRLASASGDQAVKVWDAATGREILTVRRHTGPVRSVAWSPDGKRLASGSSDRTARIWDATTGKELFSFGAFSGMVNTVAWSPDGQRLGAAGSGGDDSVYPGTVKVWDTANGKEVLDLKGQGELVMAWAPDGKRFATRGKGWNEVRVWDAVTGKQKLSFRAKGWEVFALAWSPDGKRLASGGFPLGAQVWDATTGREVLNLRQAGSVDGVAWSADGKRLATACWGQKVSVWDTTTGAELLTLRGHRGWVHSVAWSPDGSRLASAGRDKTVKIWDARRNQENLAIERAGAERLAWSPKGNRIASADGKKVKLWDPKTGAELFSLEIPANSAAWSPDGKRLAATSGTRTVIVDAETRKPLITLQSGGWLEKSWSPDGTRLAFARYTAKTAEVWDTSTGKQVILRHGPAEDRATAIAWSPDGARVASTGPGIVTIWDPTTGKDLLVLRGHVPDRHIRSVAWSPDGKRLASGRWDHLVKVWDTSNGRELLSLAGHTGNLLTVDWSPDGKRLASAGFDGVVRIWDPATGQELASLPGTFAAWSPDGQSMATIGDPDGTIRIYDASIGYALASTGGGEAGRPPPIGDKAVQWMEKNNPKDEQLLRFRAEARELLGIPEKPETGKEKAWGKDEG